MTINKVIFCYRNVYANANMLTLYFLVDKFTETKFSSSVPDYCSCPKQVHTFSLPSLISYPTCIMNFFTDLQG